VKKATGGRVSDMKNPEADHYKKKHPDESMPNPALSREIERRSAKGELPCAVAFEIARISQVPPAEVGRDLDLLEIRISKCQLGLFGYRPEKRIVRPAENLSPELSEAIRKAAVDGRLSCTSAWEIARRLGFTRMAVASACEALRIKISGCQLGAF
jgi:hypothetical protein